MSRHTVTFHVTSYTSASTQIQLNTDLATPLPGTSVITLNVIKAGVGVATYGMFNKTKTTAKPRVCDTEWIDLADAFDGIAPPVDVVVCYDDRDDVSADFVSIRLASGGFVVRNEIASGGTAVLNTAKSIDQRLAQELTAAVVQLKKLNQFVRIGLRHFHVPESELPPLLWDTSDTGGHTSSNLQSTPPPAGEEEAA